MSALDSMRTTYPPMPANPPRTALAPDIASLQRALQDAAITIPQLLRRRAEVHGDRLALREKDYGIWNRYSWSHYYETARLVALGLMSLGIKAGDRVAIAGENTPEWFYADLGTQMIGAVAVGIYPTNPWVELQYIVRHSGSHVVITGDQEQTDKVLDAMANDGGLPAVEAIVCVDMKGLRHYPQKQLMSFEMLCDLGKTYALEHPEANANLDRLIDQASPDDVCILVYTSGTTGPPKGAMLTHRNLIYAAYIYAEAVDIADKPFESVCYLPLCHVAERCYSEVMQLVLGGTVSFAESIDTVALNIREIAPTFFVGVPRIYEKLQQGSCSASAKAAGCGNRSPVPASPGAAPCRTAGRTAARTGSTRSPTPCSTSPCSATYSGISASPAAATGSAPAHRSRRRHCASSTSSAAPSRKAMA
jgi:long-chain acyl-CoA synthetase